MSRCTGAYSWAVLSLLLFKAGVGSALAQTDDSLSHSTPQLSVSGFVDVYYAYDFNKPATDYRQPFLFNHNRHNEFNLNLGLLQLAVKNTKYRGNIALQAGTYAEDNYAAEQGLLKHVFEANAGISLNRKNTLWLDAGIFGSHIGFESAISTKNLTLTRSLLAENSPYFLAGAKIAYEPNENWLFSALVANGWQRIRRVQGSTLPSFGTQVSYTHADHYILNWSTFIGTDDPDANRRMRYFNNLYGKFFITPHITIISGFDIGFQQKSKHSSKYNHWLSPVLITQYKMDNNWAIALRAEYYADKNAVIISNPALEQFKTSGFSANLDYTLASNIACRLEGRWLHSSNHIFQKEDRFVQNNAFIIGSMAVRLGY